MKVVHIITGLGDGGAEHTLYKVCKYDINNNHFVISLTGPGKYYTLLKKLKIEVYCFNLNIFAIHKFFALIKLIHFLKPDVVQTWLVHADFIGGIAARLAGIKNILWNIRYSKIEMGKAKLSTIFIIKILAKLSFLIPKYIIIVSKRARDVYKKEGYNKNIFQYIPNGYDLSILTIDKIKKINFKKKINVHSKTPLIGNVARYDLLKDHLNLFEASSILRLKKIDFLCLLVGSNITKKNNDLIAGIKKFNLFHHVKLLGKKDDITEVMNGLDVYIQSSSFGEGFPNVLAEAMACGTPSVVTDVGDASLIVGNNGWVVPIKNPIKLSISIEKAINEIKTAKWNKRCNQARSRIKENYDISKMIKRYNVIWKNACR